MSLIYLRLCYPDIFRDQSVVQYRLTIPLQTLTKDDGLFLSMREPEQYVIDSSLPSPKRMSRNYDFYNKRTHLKSEASLSAFLKKGMSFVSQTVAGLSQTRREDPPPPPRQYCSHRQARLQLSRKNSLPEWDPPVPRARKNSLPSNILEKVSEEE